MFEVTMTDALLLHRRDARGVHTLTLNHPKAFNVLSEAMLAALKQARPRWPPTRKPAWW